MTNLPLPDAYHMNTNTLGCSFLLWDLEYILDQEMLKSYWAMDEQSKILFNTLCGIYP